MLGIIQLTNQSYESLLQEHSSSNIHNTSPHQQEDKIEFQKFSNIDPNSMNSIHLEFDTSIYSQEAINMALYEYAGRFFIHQEKIQDKPYLLKVTLLVKNLEEKLTECEISNLHKELEQSILDFQLRIDLERRFGHIRDLIVAEAFKPISK